MNPDLQKLTETEEYKKLVSQRSRSKWILTILMMLVYYGFVMVIAFEPEIFAAKIGDGPTSVGIAAGFLVILFSFVITGLYVHKANKVYEPLTEELHKKAEGK